MAGKGDKRRPLKVDEEQFKENWDRIFARTKEQLLEQDPPEEAIKRREFCEQGNREVGTKGSD